MLLALFNYIHHYIGILMLIAIAPPCGLARDHAFFICCIFGLHTADQTDEQNKRQSDGFVVLALQASKPVLALCGYTNAGKEPATCCAPMPSATGMKLFR